MVRKVLKVIVVILIIIILLVVCLLAYISINEYKPSDIEAEEISGNALETIETDTQIKILTWNIGYAGLDETQDFFMDGGKRVLPYNYEEVKTNMDCIVDDLKEINADIFAVQEIDIDSKRTFKIDETQMLKEAFDNYNSAFSYNFNSKIVPYPIPPLGKIESGIMTMSKYKMDNSRRVSLPVLFKWPVRTVNLKRCVQQSHFEIKDSSKELVVFNLHLEAFDSGEGKIAQTKKLVELMNEQKENGNYVIALGDFNQVFSSVDTSKYPNINPKGWQPGYIEESEFGDGWNFYMDNSTPTCRSTYKPYINTNEHQYFMIDGMICSDNIKVDSIKTINKEFKNSDHNPVVATITLEE